MNHKLVAKNTQLPAAAEQVYYTVGDNQTRVRVRILQGEAHQAEACIPVGECWIDGLPPNLAKGSPVRVRCGVAANGRIEVTATDLTSGRAATAAIHRHDGRIGRSELGKAAQVPAAAIGIVPDHADALLVARAVQGNGCRVDSERFETRLGRFGPRRLLSARDTCRGKSKAKQPGRDSSRKHGVDPQDIGGPASRPVTRKRGRKLYGD